jgi:hypothetical protein
MPKQDIVEKFKFKVDGEEVVGLIARDAINVESDVVEIPGFDKVVPVSNGVKKMPQILLTLKNSKDTQTLKFMRDWYFNNEEKQCIGERVDGTGEVFEEIDFGSCQLGSNNIPAYDAAAPVAAQIQALLLPESFDPVV